MSKQKMVHTLLTKNEMHQITLVESKLTILQSLVNGRFFDPTSAGLERD
jgi:hypothetical protein